MTNTKTIKGRNIQGDSREYMFRLVDAETGTEIFHEYVSVIVQMLPDGLDLSNLGAIGEDGIEIDFKQTIVDLKALFPFSELKKLAKTMLGGGTVKIDGREWPMRENGFGDYAKGDPLEVYTALLYAFRANYPKYIDPLFDALEENQGDSSQ